METCQAEALSSEWAAACWGLGKGGAAPATARGGGQLQLLLPCTRRILLPQRPDQRHQRRRQVEATRRKGFVLHLQQLQRRQGSREGDASMPRRPTCMLHDIQGRKAGNAPEVLVDFVDGHV